MAGITGTQFIPIYLNVGTTPVTSVQGNIIDGISMSRFVPRYKSIWSLYRY